MTINRSVVWIVRQYIQKNLVPKHFIAFSQTLVMALIVYVSVM